MIKPLIAYFVCHVHRIIFPLRKRPVVQTRTGFRAALGQTGIHCFPGSGHDDHHDHRRLYHAATAETQ